MIQAILNLKDGETLPYAITNVQIKGAAGTKFILTVNDKVVPESRIGKRSELESKSLLAWEYIGVTLNPGENVISARQVDSFGNVRGSASVKVIAPGTMAKIVIDTVDTATADGTTAISVKVRLVDAKGVLVTTRTW